MDNPAMRWMRTVAFLLAAALVLGACTSTDEGGNSSDSSGSASGSTDSLTVMEFNIEYGGKLVDFNSVIEAIELSGADVVAVEEAEENIPEIADELGWPYYDDALSVVSQKKLIPLPDNDAVLIELEPGKVVALANVHLSSSPYSIGLIQNKNYSLDEVLSKEAISRVPEIEAVLKNMQPLVDEGFPTVIAGDFNTASHHDWTEEMVGARPQIKYPVEWPVTVAVEGAGFVDSYRAIHPNPAEYPGLTWPAGRPELEKGWNPRADAPADRIDMIFSTGPMTATDSWVMGEEGAADSVKSVTPWPTDHRAVISSFDVDLAKIPSLPNLVSVPSQLVKVGEDLEVTFHGTGEEGESVTVTSEGSPVVEASTDGKTDGSVTFETAEWASAPHEISLVSMDGTELATMTVWALDPNEGPTISTGKKSYSVGESIDVSWYGAPGNRWDWVGTFKRGAKNGQYIQYEYTGATVVGETKISSKSPGPWPLEPGRYSMRLLLNDGYVSVAETDFVVVAEG